MDAFTSCATAKAIFFLSFAASSCEINDYCIPIPIRFLSGWVLYPFLASLSLRVSSYSTFAQAKLFFDVCRQYS